MNLLSGLSMIIKQFPNKFPCLHRSDRLSMPVFSYIAIINRYNKYLKTAQYLNKLHKETTFPGTALHLGNSTISLISSV